MQVVINRRAMLKVSRNVLLGRNYSISIYLFIFIQRSIFVLLFGLFSFVSFRKNCTSCKCPREDHDVCHEEWASVRSRLGLKADESNGLPGFSDPRERGLAWAPPGLPSHKVIILILF